MNAIAIASASASASTRSYSYELQVSCQAAVEIPLRSLHAVWVNVEIPAIAQVRGPWNMQSNFSYQLPAEEEEEKASIPLNMQIRRYITSFILLQCICFANCQ